MEGENIFSDAEHFGVLKDRVRVALTRGSRITLDYLDQHHQLTRQLDVWVDVGDMVVRVDSALPWLGRYHPAANSATSAISG